MIQEVREEILLKNGLILYTGDLIEIKYKSDEDIDEQICTGRIKEAKELLVRLDTSKKYKASEKSIYSWEIKDIKKVGDENEKNN
ncbi:hypothetical protein [Clostridioides difficile]|uniref:hypothetical protein n=1 Tax=Clostridioides difficile TaxID=1496 RepID=UPI001C13FC90|nr:hypothetical protein [Clostridioides difficile]MDF3817572.1 hypothetical protein [Clostridioides difficile]HBF4283344.1 hypothetical protein [Clostridioides difficile]HBF5048868.1 hypothetical protein [Clostridioides difficile]HBF5114762.1 hypothetical protein [Clostridioides difficile]HBF5876703.1 hypothetical protein [Clostridioides difficile]